jgi:ubiquinone/menaquinone biosynthesis C-methylase UbiE
VRHYYADLVGDLQNASRGLPFVVDLCCGTGKASLPHAAAGTPVLAMDVSFEMLSRYSAKCVAAGLTNVLLVQGDVTAPPLCPASAPFVQVIGGLHHLPDRVTSFRNIVSLLEPGGTLVLHEPLIPDPAPSVRLFAVLNRLLAMLDVPRLV